MKNAVTAVFELNWTVRIAEDRSNGAAYESILAASKEYDPKFPSLAEACNYIFVLDMPKHEGILGALLYGCKIGGYSYNVRWFTGELTVTQGT